MTVPAGWYPDPQDQNTLRYWDGGTWTEHRAPAQPDGGAQPSAGDQPGQTGPAHSDATTSFGAPGQFGANSQAGQQASPYGSAPAPGTSDQTAAYDPTQVAPQAGGTPTGEQPWSPSGTSGPGGYGAASGGGYGAPSTGGYGAPSAGGYGAPSAGGYGAYGQAAPPPTSNSKTGLFIGLGIAALVLVVVIYFAVKLISGLGGSDPDPTADPTTQSDPTPTQSDPTPTQSDPTDPPPAGGETFVPGDTVQVEVPEGGEANYTLIVEQAGVYWLDTFSERGEADPILEVVGPDGTEWRDDDGSTESDNTYDASLTMALAPGEYQVRVTDYEDVASSFELRSGGAEAESVEPGEHNFTVREGGTWLVRVPVSAGDTIAVDVRDADEDAIAAVALSDGTYEENDDRSSTAPDGDNLDPYVEVTSSADGDALVMVWGYSDVAVEGTVTITVE